jgi:hypothetical protein
MNSQTIIGIGTARGGTQSLAHWLSEQGLDIGHEETWSLDWRREVRDERYGWNKRRLQDWDGDVACWLTQAAGDLLSDLPEAKCVAMLRPQEDVVESLVETMPPHRIRDGRMFSGLPFPNYKEGSTGEAWAKYWEDYCVKTRRLKEFYPSRVLKVPLYELEEEDTQREIADFLEIEDPQILDQCHKGKRQNR